MKISICDDQQHFRDAIKNNLLRYKELYCSDEEVWEIFEFSDGNVLIAENDKSDLYFLDLEMPAKDGIQVAGELRQKWGDEINIIIMTSHIERMKEGYRVNAFRFMTKPVDYEEMKEGLDTLQRSRIGYGVLQLSSYGREYKILERDIRYICRESGDTVIYVKDMKFRSEQSMEEWEGILDDRLFFRCHKGYIINVRFVEDVDDNAVLDSGEIIPVSRRRKVTFKDKVREYDLTYGG